MKSAPRILVVPRGDPNDIFDNGLSKKCGQSSNFTRLLMLGEAGLTPEKIETHADVTLEKVGDGFEITASHLTVSARIPGTDNAKFQHIAYMAKTGCPASKLLKAQITMDAKLEA